MSVKYVRVEHLEVPLTIVPFEIDFLIKVTELFVVSISEFRSLNHETLFIMVF